MSAEDSFTPPDHAAHLAEVGRRVAELSAARGLSQRKLEELANLSQSSLGKLWKGVGRLTREKLVQIAAALEVDPVALVVGTPLVQLLDDPNDPVQIALTEAGEGRAAAEARAGALEARVAALEEVQRERDQTIAALRAQLAQRDDELTRARAEGYAWQDTLQETQQALQAVEGDLARERAQAQRALRAGEAERARLQGQVMASTKQISDLTQARDALQERVRVLTDERAQLRSAHAELARSAQHSQTQLAAAEWRAARSEQNMNKMLVAVGVVTGAAALTALTSGRR
jgi:transcriptional regulator with XRE-family HTH domain